MQHIKKLENLFCGSGMAHRLVTGSRKVLYFRARQRQIRKKFDMATEGRLMRSVALALRMDVFGSDATYLSVSGECLTTCVGSIASERK